MLTCSSSNSPCRLLMICCWNCEWSCCILVRRCFSAESCSHCSLCWMAPCFCCSAKSSSSSYVQHGALTNDGCCIAGQHHVLQPGVYETQSCISLRQCMFSSKLWAYSMEHSPIDWCCIAELYSMLQPCMQQLEVTALQIQSIPIDHLRVMPVCKQAIGKGMLSWQDQAAPVCLELNQNCQSSQCSCCSSVTCCV